MPDIPIPGLEGEQVLRLMVDAAVAGINEVAARVFEQSQVEVPKGDNVRDTLRHDVTLEESGRYPGNDPELAANPAKLEATVVYEHPAAMAQEEGEALIHRASGVEVAWKVANYTTLGTKAHYLSDPFKAAMPELEAAIGVHVRLALEL